MRRIWMPAAMIAAALGWQAQSPAKPRVLQADLQPLASHAERVAEALSLVGSPLSDSERKALAAAAKLDPATGAAAIEKLLDRRTLCVVNINPEARVKVQPGPAKPELIEAGWRTFLLKVTNEAGVTARLNIDSPNAGQLANSPSDQLANRWLQIMPFTNQPLRPELSGLSVEYRVVSLYSRDAGKREAKLRFNAGQGTQDLGFRNELDVLFTAAPASNVTLNVKDVDGTPTMASFVIRDASGRVYPSQAKRLAPDFFFHPQIYRKHGEVVKLPAGRYTVEVGRGPEYLTEQRQFTVTNARKQNIAFQLSRWIDPSKMGWWSGDHHIHAAGCSHYTNPTEGVHAPDMLRHCLGEDLKVGCNLTWGPCFDYQKQFFTGAVDKVSRYPYLLRYDVEVSGFGSHQSGHLCLLRLSDQMYPGGTSKDHWPTLGLNTLRWAKKQGALTGPAHSGWGLEVQTSELPNYVIPPYNGIGANEYIVDVTHQVPGPGEKMMPAVDFISTVDTPHVWELNIWYHTLNAGFRTRISGETDFPCIYGERVGLGRSYVKQDGQLDFDRWVEEIRRGRNYVSDGRSHLIDFKVNDVALGEKGSQVSLARPGSVRVGARVAAMLPEKADETIRARPYNQKPYWHIERARIGSTRTVPVEVIVNGYPVARKEIPADGGLQDLSFDVPIERSSWVALRILPSSHTNPVWVVVDDKPVLPSKRSVEWCLKGVDQCWTQKQRFIRPEELSDARSAYDHARKTYRELLPKAHAD